MDALFIILGIGFFVLSAGLVVFSGKIMES
jgi:hypothetical protein